jgi:hypothetical protein
VISSPESGVHLGGISDISADGQAATLLARHGMHQRQYPGLCCRGRARRHPIPGFAVALEVTAPLAPWDYVPNVAWSDVGDQEINFLSFVNVLGSVAVAEGAVNSRSFTLCHSWGQPYREWVPLWKDSEQMRRSSAQRVEPSQSDL